MANEPVPKKNEIVVLERDASLAGDDKLAPEFRAVVDLTREQLRIQDRRNDVTLAAIKASTEADQRQFDYHSQKLKDDSADRKARLRVARGLLIAAFVIGVPLIIFLLWMLFFGSPGQSKLARELVAVILALAGGGGLYKIGQSIFQKFVR